MPDEKELDLTELDAKAIMAYDILKVAEISELLFKAEQRCTASKNAQLQDISDALKKYDNKWLDFASEIRFVSDADTLAQSGITRAESIHVLRKYLCNLLSDTIYSRVTQKLCNATTFDLAHKLLLMASDIPQNTTTIMDLDILEIVYGTFHMVIQENPHILNSSELAIHVDIMRRKLSEQFDNYSHTKAKEGDAQLQEAREIRTCIEHTVKILQNDSVFNDNSYRSYLENSLKKNNNMQTESDIKRDCEYIVLYYNLNNARKIAQLFFRKLLLDCNEYITRLSAILEKNNAVLGFTEKNVFSCRHHIPSDTLVREAAAEHLKNSIADKNENIAINSFEKLLILNPEEVTKKEADKISSICSNRKKGTQDFLGDLGCSIREISNKVSTAPIGKTPSRVRRQNLLYSFLCAAAALLLALIGLEKVAFAAVIIENGSFLLSLAVTICCIIICYKIFDIFGILIGIAVAEVVKRMFTIQVLFNLLAIVFAIACIAFLYCALKSDRKKRAAREEYLDKAKKGIKIPTDHIRLILNQLEKVPADIDTSGIRAYYEDASKYLTQLKHYK